VGGRPDVRVLGAVLPAVVAEGPPGLRRSPVRGPKQNDRPIPRSALHRPPSPTRYRARRCGDHDRPECAEVHPARETEFVKLRAVGLDHRLRRLSRDHHPFRRAHPLSDFRVLSHDRLPSSWRGRRDRRDSRFHIARSRSASGRHRSSDRRSRVSCRRRKGWAVRSRRVSVGLPSRSTPALLGFGDWIGFVLHPGTTRGLSGGARALRGAGHVRRPFVAASVW
jgi:hypothetical protein